MTRRTARRLLLAALVGAFAVSTVPAEAAQVTGVVSALPGASPVGDVTVTVRDHATSSIVAGATTDLGGNYSVTVPNGDYDFTFQPSPMSQLRTAAPPTIHVSGDRVVNMGLTREGVFRFAGVVRDAAGHPVPGVSIQLTGSSSSANGESATDGSFALAVAPDTYDVALWQNGKATGANTPQDWNAQGKLTISGDREEDIVIPAREVTVHVTDPDGQPISGATLDTSEWLNDTDTIIGAPFNVNDYDFGLEATTATNGNGHLWLFDHTTDNAKIRITPPAGSGLATALVTIPTFTSDTTINAVLSHSFRFAGVVRDAAGHPVPGVSIQLTGSSSSANGESATDGSFALAVAPDTYDVALWQNGKATGANTPQDWNAQGKLTISGDREEDIVIPAREVTVHVTDPDGQPISGATLDTSEWLNDTDTIIGAPFNVNDYDFGLEATTATNGNGHLWLFDHTTDNAKIRITPPAGSGLATALVTIPTFTSDTTINAVLSHSFRFAGVVRDAAGHPVPGVSIQLTGSSSSANGESATDGSFALAVAPDTYDVALWQNGKATGANTPQDWNAQGKLTISGDREEDIVIPAREVTVHVTDPDGQPISGATLDTSEWLNDTDTIIGAPFNVNDYDFGLEATTATNGNGHLWLFDHTTDNAKIRITPPAGSGLATALVTIPTFTSDTTINVQLKGDQVVAVALSPDRAPFSRTLPGEVSTPTTFRLTNIAGPALAVSGVALTSGATPEFHVDSDTCSSVSVPAGGSCTFQASFRPTSVGTKSAQLAVTDSGPGSPRAIELSGRGVANQVAGRVLGRTVAGTTAPLADVQVEVRSSSATVATALTNAEGRYAIPLEDGTYQVAFVPPADGGYASLQTAVELPTSGPLDVVLTPKDALRVSGTIRSSLGVPVRGVRVVIDGDTGAAQTTGIDGAYTAAVSRGAHQITLSDDGTNDGILPAQWSLHLETITVLGDQPALDITLPAVYTLTTRVLAADGSPLPGVDVTNLDLPVAPTEVAPRLTTSASAVSGVATATTDSKGFVHSKVFQSTAGHGTVAASSTNPTTPFPVPAISRDTTVSVRADGSATPIVSFLTGTVRSATGQSLPGVQVASTGDDTAQTTTAADGSYESAVDAGSRTFELDAHGIQQVGLPKDWVLPTGPTTLQSDRTLDFTLPPVQTLTVRVLDGHDQPVAGAVVTGPDGGANLELPVAPTAIAPGLTTTTDARSRPAAVTTATDGTARFHVFRNTAGRALVLAGSGHPQTAFDVPAASGDTTVVVHVETPPTLTVRGVVRSASGVPVPGVQVAIGDLSARTDADGSYAIPDLTPDRYAVFLSGNGLTGLPQAFQLRSTPIEVDQDLIIDWTLPPTHTLTIAITDDTGTPLEGAAIGTGTSSTLTIPVAPGQIAPGIAIDSGYSAATKTTGTDGTTINRIFDSTPTTARIQPLRPFAPATVAIPALNDDHEVTVNVSQHTATVRGVVRSASGVPVPGVQVAIGDLSARTDADGSYAIPDLTPDRYAVFLSGNGLTGLPQAFQLRSTPIEVDQDLIIDWTLPPTHTLTIAITDDTGTPLEGAAIGTGTSSTLTIPVAPGQIAPGIAIDSGYSAATKTTGTDGTTINRIFDSTPTTARIQPLGNQYLEKTVLVPAVTADRTLAVRFTVDDLNPDPDHSPPDLPRGISGHVVGRSIAGTTVPLGNVRVDVRHEGVTVASGSTNAAGDYVVPVIDGTYDVRFTPPEASLYAPLTQSDVTVARAFRSDVVLTPNDAVRVDGTVRSAAGEPFAGVKITLSGDVNVLATTATDGSFAAAVSPGAYELELASGSVSVPETPANWTLHTKTVEVQKDMNLQLVLPTVHALTLEVLKPDDSPLAEAQVNGLLLPVARRELAPGVITTQSSRSGPAAVRADVSGRVTVPVFASSPAPAEVAAGPDNLLTLFQVPSISVDTTLTVRADGATRARLTGTVRTAAGREVGGASVAFDGPERSGQATAADGTYEAALTPGAYQMTISGGDAGGDLPQQWSLPLETTSVQDDRTLDIDLPAVHTLTIAVRDNDNRPLAGAQISGLSLPVAALDIAPGVAPTAAALSGPRTAVTGSDGTVSVQVFSSKPAAAEILEGAANPRTQFEIPSVTRDTVLVVRADGLTRVKASGKVTTADGVPVQGVHTSLVGPDTAEMSTEPDGSFAAALTPGVYGLRLDAPVAAPSELPSRWSLPLEATSIQTDRDLAFKLPAVHDLRLRVLGAEDQPLVDAKISGLELPMIAQQIAPGIATTSEATSGTPTVTTDADGTAEVLVFPSGGGHAEIAAGPENPRVSFDVPAVIDDTSVTVRIADHADVVRPHVVCAAGDTAWHPDNVEVLCTAEDGGSGLANPQDASFELRTSIPIGAESASATTDTRQVCDVAGNCATAGPITHLSVDRQSPDPKCATPAAGWSGADVSIVCAPRDSGAGLMADTPGRFLLSTSTSPGTENPVAPSDSRIVCDAVGNCSIAGPFSVHVDRRPPTTACGPVDLSAMANARIACRSSDGGAGLSNPADAAFELSTTVGAGERDSSAMTGTREVCDNVGNCATIGPFGPFDVRVPSQSSADSDGDGVPDTMDFCPHRAGACVPVLPGATTNDRDATEGIASRAVAAGCRTADHAGAWTALVDIVRGKVGTAGANALTNAGSGLCIGGIVAFAVGESSPRPDARTNDAYVSPLPTTLSQHGHVNASCHANRYCPALTNTADRLNAAASTFDTSLLELAVARNRFATATVLGKKNDAALQMALLTLAEGNVAVAQKNADTAEQGLARQLRRSGVNTRLSATAFEPVLAAIRSGDLPPSAVAATSASQLDTTELTERLGALPLLSADLNVGDVWTESGTSSREAIRRKLTLSQLERIIPNLLTTLGTRTTKRLIADLQTLSSACTQHAQTRAMRRFRQIARNLTSTRMLDTAVDPLVIDRRHCGS